MRQHRFYVRRMSITPPGGLVLASWMVVDRADNRVSWFRTGAAALQFVRGKVEDHHRAVRFQPGGPVR